MRIFYSGISTDKSEFLINMKYYRETDINICFKRSAMYHGLKYDCKIDINDFVERYLVFEWNGDIYYPKESDELNGELIRIYRIV